MISKLFCKIGIHQWGLFNSIHRLENGELVSDEGAVYTKQQTKELIQYDICKSCNKIKIFAHYKWELGTERFGDNLVHDNDNRSLEAVIREYFKNNEKENIK